MSILIAFCAGIVFHMFLIRIAARIDLVDEPGGRKAHQGAVPLVGGLAMFLAFVFGLLALEQPLGGLRAFVAGSALMVIVGVLDDMHELSPNSRFLAQIGAALLMIYWGDVQLSQLGDILLPGRPTNLGFWAVPITVFAVVGVINALNMIDGVDGLAGLVSSVTVASLATASWLFGAHVQTQLLLTLLGALVAFLHFNLRVPWQPKARVFMGDAGSMFLGFALAWLVVDMSQRTGDEQAIIRPVTALWILALPLIDTVAMMIRRAAKGRSPFAADREHFHHIWLAIGFSPGQTTALMAGLAVLGSVIGLAGQKLQVPDAVMFYGFLAVFGAHYYLTMRAWKFKRFFKRKMHVA